MTHTTHSLVAITNAALAADGWYDATARNTARFCTEALIDAAESCLDGMTQSERDRYCYSDSRRAYGRNREWALNILCAWAHAQRMRAWVASYERAREDAARELPAALEALGAAL